MGSLFRAFGKDKISGHSQLKSSAQRSIKGEQLCACRQPRQLASATHTPPLLACSAAAIVEQYPWLQESGVIDVLLPKKQDLTLIKL